MILVLGRSGQVGSALAELLGDQAVVIDREEADMSKPQALAQALSRYEPSAVINAAAYTQVDQAEKETELAQAINAESPGVLARWCAERGIPFVHYSTDYVFPGNGLRPWTEDDFVGPLNAYGRTKLKGEQNVTAAGGKHLIFRTSWVYDSTGKNFVNTMLRLGREREKLRVVADQIGAPTYAPHLAEATLRALQNAGTKAAFPSGIYHLCNGGETSWHEFAEMIFDHARRMGLPLVVKDVEAIPSSAYATPAQRPMNSRMSTEKAKRVLGVSLPHWSEGLEDCMKLIEKNSREKQRP